VLGNLVVNFVAWLVVAGGSLFGSLVGSLVNGLLVAWW